MVWWMQRVLDRTLNDRAHEVCGKKTHISGDYLLISKVMDVLGSCKRNFGDIEIVEIFATHIIYIDDDLDLEG